MPRQTTYLLVAVGMILSACSASGDGSSQPATRPPAATPASAATQAPAATPAPAQAESIAGHEYDTVVVAAQAAAAADLPATLRIDLERPLGPVSPLLFGTNQAWLPSEHLMAGNAGAPLPEFLTLARGLPMPLNRMGGTDSEYFHWKQAIGPLAGRTPIADEYKHAKVRALGPVEWIRCVTAIDPAARFCWTFNCTSEEPADHADLAEFLTGKPGADPNGGEDWAARRVACGLPDPVPVAIWEIGNELDKMGRYSQRFPSAVAYADYAARTISAVRAVQPDASFCVLAGSAPWDAKWKSDWKEWHRTLLKTVGKDIDWLAFHPYYNGMPISDMERFIDVLRDDCAKLVPGHPIRLFMSEHAVWPEIEKGRRWELNWYRTHNLNGCLGTGRFLIRMLQRPEVGAATYHCLSGGPWGLFYDYDFVAKKATPVWRTGMADLLTMFKPLQGGEVLVSTLEGARTAASDPAASCAAAVVRHDARLTLALVNGEATAARPLQWTLPGTWRIAGGSLLSAADLDACNSLTATAITVDAIAPVAGSSTGWTIPARSLAILHLERMP